MRYESPSFRIDKRDWLKGMNAYDDYPEGGMLSSSVGGNPFYKPGLLAGSPDLGASVTTSLPVNGVISWGIGNGSSAPAIMAVMTDASDNGSFWSVNSSTGAMAKVGSDDTTQDYILGITDTVFYKGKFYTSTDTDIVQQDPDLTNRVTDWWTSQTDTLTSANALPLTSGIPHPLLVYEDIMYVADGKYLHKNDNGIVTTQVFDVLPDHIITAMVEWNGLIYVVAEPYKNLDGAVHGRAQMFSWDGLTDSWYQQYLLDYRINSLFVYKNTLMGWTNQYMGMWNGSEFAPQRPVTNQIFKCHITTTADSMWYVDGNVSVRFGAPYIPGLSRKYFNYFVAPDSPDQEVFAAIISMEGNNMLLIGQGGAHASNYLVDDVNVPSDTSAYASVFNPRVMKQPVKLRGIVVETEALGSGESVQVGYLNDKGETKYPAENNGTFDNAVTGMAGKSFHRFEVSGHPSTRLIKPLIITTGTVRVRSVDYVYEGSESKQNA